MAGPNIDSTAEWRYAENLDLFGASCYPSWGEMGDPDLACGQRVRKSYEIYNQLWQKVLM